MKKRQQQGEERRHSQRWKDPRRQKSGESVCVLGGEFRPEKE